MRSEQKRPHLGATIPLQLKVYDQDGSLLDISAATTLQMLVKKPSDTSVSTEDASFVTDGQDGELEYTALLDETGLWRYQGVVTMLTGEVWLTDIETFYVEPNLT